MPNDTSTLNGSLLEMKDQLIYELGQKGVTASYDSSTGLLGLIGEISNIQQGGSCYHIELDQTSYTTTTGSLTVSATVLKNYSACVGETVTFTGGTSTVTATTNSNGVATATVTFSASGTLTASIGGATDTATVTISDVIFYDEGSVSGLSNYNETHLVETTGNTNFTLTYDTTYNAYHLSTNSDKAVQLTFSALNGITDDFRLTVDMMNNGSWIALCYLQYTQTGFFYGGNNTKWEGHRFQNGNWQQTLNSTGSCSSMTWYTIELIKEDTTITINCWDITKTTKYATYSREYTDGDNFYGLAFYSSECYFKNVKAEYI